MVSVQIKISDFANDKHRQLKVKSLKTKIKYAHIKHVMIKCHHKSLGPNGFQAIFFVLGYPSYLD